MASQGVPSSIRDFLKSAKALGCVLDALREQQFPEIEGRRLTLAQLKLLRLVARGHVHTVRDLADLLGVSAPAVSKAVEKLVRVKLLRRAPARDDRRSIHLTLSAAGCRLLARIEAAQYRSLEAVLGDLEPEELQSTATSLDRVSAGLLELLADPGELCVRCDALSHECCLLRNLTGRTCRYHEGKGGPRESGPSSAWENVHAG